MRLAITTRVIGFNRWEESDLRDALLEALGASEASDAALQMIDATIIRAHHCASGGKRRIKEMRSAAQGCGCRNHRTINFPPVRDALGKLASQAALIEEMALGMEVGVEMRGEYYIPNRHLLYAAQVQSQEMYPQIIASIRELAGGPLLMLPFSISDFASSRPAIFNTRCSTPAHNMSSMA
jgi:aromatic ring hydroxylase